MINQNLKQIDDPKHKFLVLIITEFSGNYLVDGNKDGIAQLSTPWRSHCIGWDVRYGLGKMTSPSSFLYLFNNNITKTIKSHVPFHHVWDFGFSITKLRDKRFIIKDYIKDWPGSCTSSDMDNLKHIVSIDLVALYVQTHTRGRF